MNTIKENCDEKFKYYNQYILDWTQQDWTDSPK